MSEDVMAAVRLGPSWRRADDLDRSVVLQYTAEGVHVEIGARRSVDGRLRDAYPVSRHDVELYPAGEGKASRVLTGALLELSDAIFAADARCRRVLFASPADDGAAMSAARAAGFRYVLDVDVSTAELSLLVLEPEWVTDGDGSLDRIPDA